MPKKINHKQKNPDKKIKQQIERYKEKTIQDIPKINKNQNKHGEYLEKTIKTKKTIKKTNKNPEKHTNLKTIKGIGPKTEKKLKKQGKKTIQDLTKHKKYKEKANKHLKQTKKPHRAIKTLHKKLGSTCLEAIKHTTEIKNKETAVIDIETLGLKNKPIIMIGIAHPHKNKTKLHQIIAEKPNQEKQILYRANQLLKNKKIILTFNGLSFDIPYITKRQEKHGIPKTPKKGHIDLYHYTKKTTKMNSYTLNHIEQNILNIKRKNEVPSKKIPHYYKTYLKKQNIGPLIPIIKHNKQDILTLIKLYHQIKNKAL